MILKYTRAQVVAEVQSKILGIKSALHWDVCFDLKAGMHREDIAMKHRMSVANVDKIHQCKCPEL